MQRLVKAFALEPAVHDTLQRLPEILYPMDWPDLKNLNSKEFCSIFSSIPPPKP